MPALESEVNWAGGNHKIALRLGDIEIIQDKTGFGIEKLSQRMRNGDWKVRELLTVCNQALIGGGMPETEAKSLTWDLLDKGMPLNDFKLMGLQALVIVLLGKEDDPINFPIAGETKNPTIDPLTQTEDGSSVKSSGPVQS